MTFEVRLRPEAEHDLSDAAAWYEEQLSGLGHQFLDAVLTALFSIAEAPRRYPLVHRDTLNNRHARGGGHPEGPDIPGFPPPPSRGQALRGNDD